MARATGNKGNSGGKEQTRQPKPKSKPRPSNAELVDKALLAFEKKIETKNVTVGDFVRLLQLQKEIDGNEPKEIKVTWVETIETESSEK
jgi:hypothetical protein